MRKQDLKRVSEFIWEVPATYREDMRVPARLYASDALVEAALGDASVEQLINTATLPGLVGYALAMPDIHQGYGFPIGGVIASRTSDGVISPGGVGFDVNCISGDINIMHRMGYTRPIAEMREDWASADIVCQQFADTKESSTPIVRYLCQPPRRPVYHLTTEAGDTITATADHPFWTPDGMIPLGDLKPGDQVGFVPFEGFPYEAPEQRVLLDERDIERVLASLGKGRAGNAPSQIIKQLKKRGLIPLMSDSPAIPLLLKLLGFVLGDGHIHVNRQTGKCISRFYGKPDDLEMIRQDIERLGFTPSRIYTRERDHAITTQYGDVDFHFTEASFKVSGSNFVALLAALGAPIGNKARQDYRLPGWIFGVPRWHLRLFLAAFFGAELMAPRVYKKRNHKFPMPILAINKHDGFVESGRGFMEDIARLLELLGVRTTGIKLKSSGYVTKEGKTPVRLRLYVASTPDNLIRLWGQIGFEYNAAKRRLATLATQYLKHKQRVLSLHQNAAQRAVALRSGGATGVEAYEPLKGVHTSIGFLKHSLQRDPGRKVRAGAHFPSFDEYCQQAGQETGQSGMVWERIASIEPANDVDLVYDFTVAHPDHNFVANGFVVSNCGVRVLASHLDYEQVEPYLPDLATALYRNCPSGVGKGGGIDLSAKEFDKLLRLGGEWALEAGYAEPQDIQHTEESGRLKAADPNKVSHRAMERGIEQVGTLGAGNHFIEVDLIDEVYDAEAGDIMGLAPGRIAVQIHCGSRGFGHQICTDYVDSFQSAAHKYNIRLPDRQLICAPFKSPDGQAYYGAMCTAANYAFANRQVLAHHIRRSFEDVLRDTGLDYALHQVYDIAHNMAKVEKHELDGETVEVVVHRKGATRAFGPGFEGLPPEYRAIGQPVLVPGSMGTASWILLGTAGSMAQTFGSTCHGAGRTMSRSQAKKTIRGEKLRQDLQRDGIQVRAGSMSGLAEEAPQAYKDVDEVVRVVTGAGIARKVARLVPVAVIKG